MRSVGADTVSHPTENPESINWRKESIAHFNEAIRLKPDFGRAYVFRADNYFELGEFEQAIADYTKAIELGEGSADVYKKRGLSYRQLKMYDEAIEDFSKQIEMQGG